MLVVYHNRYHPEIEVPEPAIRQPGHRVRAMFGRIAAYLVVLGLLAYVAWAAFDLGRQQAGFHSGQARELRRELMDRLEGATDERDELKQQVVTLERAAQVDREAARQVRQTLVELQDERLELKEEIAFLSSLLSDGKVKAGLRARRFTLEALEQPGDFRYRFALSKFPQNDDPVRATLELTVVGRRNGADSNLVLKGAALGESRGSAEFKQLLQVEGTLRLPEGFEPKRIKVVVKPEKDDVLGVEREVPWVVRP